MAKHLHDVIGDPGYLKAVSILVQPTSPNYITQAAKREEEAGHANFEVYDWFLATIGKQLYSTNESDPCRTSVCRADADGPSQSSEIAG
jgi:hypothetical protein